MSTSVVGVRRFVRLFGGPDRRSSRYDVRASDDLCISKLIIRRAESDDEVGSAINRAVCGDYADWPRDCPIWNRSGQLCILISCKAGVHALKADISCPTEVGAGNRHSCSRQTARRGEARYLRQSS
jgi:hypothetical protein